MEDNSFPGSGPVALTEAEEKMIRQMRGEIPPDPHEHQELIDAREVAIRTACKKFDASILEIDAQAQARKDEVLSVLRDAERSANIEYEKAVLAKLASVSGEG